MWDALARRLDDVCEPWEADDEVVALDLADQIAGPAGVEPVADALRRCDCPVAAELLKAVDPL
jgi:hypothetical protein